MKSQNGSRSISSFRWYTISRSSGTRRPRSWRHCVTATCSMRDNQAIPAAAAQRTTVAIYIDGEQTIYLPEGWTGRTPAELSVLVHEMVHHLQNLGGLKHECPRAREKLAYAAQERWLKRFGRDLEGEFEINPFTVLVNSNCAY